MLLALERYSMTVKYRPGALQVTADILSHNPVGKATPGVSDEQIFQVQSFLSDLNITDPKQDLPILESTRSCKAGHRQLLVYRKLQSAITALETK